MKTNQNSEEKIIAILREANSTTVATAARRHSVAEATIYRWRKLYNGMPVSDVKEL